MERNPFHIIMSINPFDETFLNAEMQVRHTYRPLYFFLTSISSTWGRLHRMSQLLK